MTLSSSLEDYLEAIFHIESEKQAARVKDISRILKVNMSSVTGALRSLAEKKLINYSPYEVITLTKKGKKIAQDVILRHQSIRDFFVKVLHVEEKLADEGACRMEHEIPGEILKRLIKFVKYVETCPHVSTEWLKESEYRCRDGHSEEFCGNCHPEEENT
jgi:DtxR family Mn-dependent transcriptional regulator